MKVIEFVHPGYYGFIGHHGFQIAEDRIPRREDLIERLKKSGGKIKKFFWPGWYKKMTLVGVYTEKTSGVRFHVILDENSFSTFENALTLGSPQGIRRERFYFIESKEIKKKKCAYLNVLAYVMLHFLKGTYLMVEILKEEEKEKELEDLIREIEYMVRPDQSSKRGVDDQLKDVLRRIVKIFEGKKSEDESDEHSQQFFLRIDRIKKELGPEYCSKNN